MARPLTKTKKSGVLYTRPPGVEAQIDEAVGVSLAELRRRLQITDRNDPGYLRSECLVHVIRKGRRSDDQPLISAALPVLLGRCEANLLVKVYDGGVPDAANLRQEILDEFVEMFVTDGSGDNPDELDFYECRFNSAFMTLRVDAIRRDTTRREHEIEVVDIVPSGDTDEPETREDILARMSQAFRVAAGQEWTVSREPLLKAIDALSADERNAVILVHVLGYKEESEDTKMETAATRCKCSGRTIRNRLARAAEKLSRFQEDL